MASSNNGKPDGLRAAHPLSFFDPEHVTRPVPSRPWRAIAIGALIAMIALTAGWEIYWRAHWMFAGDMKNSNGLWAQERRKAVDDATVMIGSSRILFDTDLDVWEEASGGVRPIMLALEGTSPRIFMTDLANDESFKGTLVVGVTVPLFFTDSGGLRAAALQYTKNESPSQRMDHQLSVFLERYFAFIDEATRPKTMIMYADTPLRKGMKPRFLPRKLETMDETRNTQMWARVEQDEKFAQLAKDIWVGLIQQIVPPPDPNAKGPPGFPDEAVTPVIAEVKANVEKIRARGGDVIFLRFPYEGIWQQTEDFGFPRERVWDRLVRETDAIGIAWQDYPELQGYWLPEWSHLSAADAEKYTRALVPIFYKRLEEKKAGQAAPG